MNVKEYRDAVYEAMDNMWKGRYKRTMKAQTQKDTLFNYLKNRRYALESYIQAYKDMAEEYPETKDVNKIRIAGTELQLQEINKVIDYCEKRGRY